MLPETTQIEARLQASSYFLLGRLAQLYKNITCIFYSILNEGMANSFEHSFMLRLIYESSMIWLSFGGLSADQAGHFFPLKYTFSSKAHASPKLAGISFAGRPTSLLRQASWKVWSISYQKVLPRTGCISTERETFLCLNFSASEVFCKKKKILLQHFSGKVFEIT